MDYVKEFENDCRIRGLTKQTILTYKCNVLDFLAATHECPAAVTQGDLRDHLMILQQRNYAASTYSSYYASLNTFYEFLIYEGVTTANPIPAFRQRYLSHIMKTTHGETRQLISVEDMRQLIRSADEIRDIAMMTMDHRERRQDVKGCTGGDHSITSSTYGITQPRWTPEREINAALLQAFLHDSSLQGRHGSAIY